MRMIFLEGMILIAHLKQQQICQFKKYFKSAFYKIKILEFVIARAGNVIGGGDWSEGRLIPDCIKNGL